MTAERHTRAVLNHGSRRNTVRILILAKAIYAKMLANQALLPSPSPSLAALEQQTTRLSDAQDAVNRHEPDATGVRNVERSALLTLLEGLRTFVQTLADDAPAGQAVVIIEAAAMSVARVSAYAKPILRAEADVHPGIVHLFAAAGQLNRSRRYKTYGWEYTLDGGLTWLPATSTPVAHTTISGLPSLTTCGFRVNVSDTLGTTAWTQPVSVLVR